MSSNTWRVTGLNSVPRLVPKRDRVKLLSTFSTMEYKPTYWLVYLPGTVR